jgi:GNAT superfamily N-acetyltransferase
MIVRLTHDPSEFGRVAFPFLQRDPVLNTTVLSAAKNRIHGVLADPAVFLSVHDAGDVVGTAFFTASDGIVLGGLPTELVPVVGEALIDARPRAVTGLMDAALRYAGQTRRPFRAVERSRLHKLRRFVAQEAEGAARRAASADVATLLPLFGAYRAEVGRAGSAEADRYWLEDRARRGRLWVWVDRGQIVCLAGHQSPAFGAVRVGPVYTPPQSRGRGYGSALTAAVAQYLRATGDEVCLFTDLANPTSNKIYAAIGFRPVRDFVRYALS